MSSYDRGSLHRVSPKMSLEKYHASCHFVYNLGSERVTRRLKDLRRRYKDVAGERITAVKRIENELHSLEGETRELIEDARNCLETLREKALRPNPLSTTDYIDFMIQEEEYLAGPRWKESVRQLEKIKDEASIMNMIQNYHTNIYAEAQQSPEIKEDKGFNETHL